MTTGTVSLCSLLILAAFFCLYTPAIASMQAQTELVSMEKGTEYQNNRFSNEGSPEQQPAAARNFTEIPVYVDENGIMRWSATDEEVALFGVNYSIPFAHGYRAVNYIGADHETVIDQDVYHFARMGLDAYRIHVWDIEISNREGNLVYNDHLRLLDYLIMRLKERGIKIVLSQMRNSDNAYPEYYEYQNPDPLFEDVQAFGFSRYTPKNGGLAHHTPEGIAAQERYVRGFVNHVNEYTGISYKDDPDIIAFEINNEPHHNNSVEDVRSYINRMVSAMRETGMEKPIFYNMSHNFSVTEAFLTADIQGGTFQWYPTGLNAGFTQKGNFLPNVDRYTVPFADDPRFQQMGKLIYEFSPADVADNYLYPAMVRSFRGAGFQFITQFSYDAMALAGINSEYKTHHLNLAHTPSKGISFKIAGEAARKVPLGADYGTYPESTRFEDFRLSYEENLAEIVTDELFFYSNTTESSPAHPERLQEIAGVGSSPLVEYEGAGAYFLDRLEEGVWRLEVMPDAVMIRDPFDDPHIDKRVTRIIWNQWPINLSLPDLGPGFSYRGVNRGNRRSGVSDGGSITVSPGAYILTRNGVVSNEWAADRSYGDGTKRIGEFVAPPPTEGSPEVLHTAMSETGAESPFRIRAEIAGSGTPDRVELWYRTSDLGQPVPPETMRAYNLDRIEMERTEGYTWEAEIPADELSAGGGILYYIVVSDGGEYQTYPGGFDRRPGDWNFYHRESWQTRIVEEDAPLQLLNVERDFTTVLPLRTSFGSAGRKRLVSGSDIGNRAIRVDADLSGNNLLFLREYIAEQIDGRGDHLENFSHVVIRARGLGVSTGTLQFGFLTRDGYTYAAPFELSGEWRDIRIPLSSLEQAGTALRLTYPRMMEEYYMPEERLPFDISGIESWEISTAGLFEPDRLSYEVENIWLE
ncbi:MAG: cellulase family glycosylhydrolase [Balneolaceae bacterium]